MKKMCNSSTHLSRTAPSTHAYVLIEVLLSMTILAMAGTALMGAINNAIKTTGMVRDISKAVYLTKGKLHEIEIAYSQKDIKDVRLGQFSGNYSIIGTKKFSWEADVDYSQDHDAFIVQVITTWGEQNNRRRRGRYRGSQANQFMLRSMVLTARYNENLVNGMGVERQGFGSQQGFGQGGGLGGGQHQQQGFGGGAGNRDGMGARRGGRR